MAHQTLTDRVAALFRSRPHDWIDARELAQVGGFAAWRTRISDCRRLLGMPIENEWRTVQRDGATYRVSVYRYVPAVAVEKAS